MINVNWQDEGVWTPDRDTSLQLHKNKLTFFPCNFKALPENMVDRWQRMLLKTHRIVLIYYIIIQQ